ncbi:MAG: choice-of-anchor Q domain-containing protein [Planctomycetota bacterium]
MIVALQAVPTVRADTIYVDDDNCAGPGDGSELDPYCSIQTAIDNAVDTDEIVVAPGTYLEAINLLGKAINLHSSDGPADTTIDATGLGASVVMCITGEGPQTILEGFTFTGGTGTLFEFAPGTLLLAGGGMYNDNSSATVTDCTFTENTAYGGAGMFNNTSNPIVTGCTFAQNSGTFGGGMHNESSSPTVTDCAFDGNTVTGSGGGMYNEASNPALTGCTFENNSANFGGGIFNTNSSPTLSDCTITGNLATNNGGGMTNTLSSSPTVTNCAFIQNSANIGGGMLNNGGSPALTNCTFIGNSADARGGGMYNGLSSSPTLTNCTFHGNSAGRNGGGMHNSNSSPTVTNCILWGDMPDEIANSPTGTSLVSWSDVQGSGGSAAWDALLGTDGGGNIDRDPMFADADRRLSPGSPCIDAGDSAAVPPDQDTDLDGDPRFVNDPCTADTGSGDPPIVDMGAYEFQCTSCDLVINGAVEVSDFLSLLANWGPCGNCQNCPGDFDGDCEVGVADFLILLANWGPCP